MPIDIRTISSYPVYQFFQFLYKPSKKIAKLSRLMPHMFRIIRRIF